MPTMQAYTLHKLSASLVWGMWSISSLGQNLAVRPDLHVGDRWVFHETGTDDGRPIDRRWSREIVEITPDGAIRIKRGDGNLLSFDLSWNPRPANHPEIGHHNFEFPLEVGTKWTYSSSSGERFWYQSRHEVVAFETITVPAGTYECFRLEGENRYDEKYYGERWYLTRWYCPIIRYVAKQHLVLDIRRAGPGSRRVLDSELIRFKAGN